MATRGTSSRAALSEESAATRPEQGKPRPGLPPMALPGDRGLAPDLLEHLAVGVSSLDASWRVRYVNRAAARLVQMDPADMLGRDHWELFPALRNGPAEKAYRRALTTGQPVSIEHHYEPFDAWYETTAVPHADGLTLYFSDISDRRRAEEQTTAAMAETRSALRRLEILADAGRVLAASLDVTTTLRDALRLLVPSLGVCALVHLLEDDQVVLAAAQHADPEIDRARALWTFPSETLVPGESAGAARVVQTGTTELLPPLTRDVALQLAPDEIGADLLVELGLTGGVAVPMTARGRTLGCLSICRDNGVVVSADEVSLLEEFGGRIALAVDNAQLYAGAQAAAARLELLADVSRTIGATMDPEEALRGVSALVVPLLADWCIASLVETDDLGHPRVRDVGWCHRDQGLLPILEEYATRRMQFITPDSPLFASLREGRAVQQDLPAPTLEQLVPDAESRELITQLGAATAVTVPITTHGRALGVLTLYNRGHRAPMTTQEIEAAVEVAARAALALENARLFARERHTAEVLQRSMLTPPPEPDHLHVVVRYTPAASEAQVGGDWYDSFLTSDGATALVIGDVMGHDTLAAAAMGQLRTLVRGIAYDRSEGPAKVLERVDRSMAALAPGVLATSLMARIEQNEAEKATGMRRIRWSSAGHPPAMLLRPNGAVEQLDHEADLLLGLDSDTPRSEYEVELEPGATILLYTDGLVERRGESFTDSLVRLEDALSALRRETLDDLCDGLLARLLPDGSPDDVALVAVRAHDEDKPRPAEAGPGHVPPHP